jgi:homocysteine S-methyltransferase
MKNELRVSVPDEIMRRMAKAANAEEARAEGVAIAREMLLRLRDVVQGAQISAPFGKYNAAVDVLEVLGNQGGRASAGTGS